VNWKNEKVIVTGGAGVIGRVLIEKLAKRGAKVGCFDIVSRLGHIHPEVEYCQLELVDVKPKKFIAFRPKIIFHLAATFERTGETTEFWEVNFKNNIQLTHKVISVANNCQDLQKFVFASSYLVYSPALYLNQEPPSKAIKLEEENLKNPRNLCGAAKYYAEKELEYIEQFKECAFKSISARIFRVYGCGSKDVISRWVRAGLRGEAIEVFRGDNSFDYIFADDVAEGLIRLAEIKDAHGPVNLGSGVSRKIAEVVKIIQRETPNLRVKEVKRDGLFEASCADLSKLSYLTGWQPQIRLEQGIKKIVDDESKSL